MFHAYPVDQIRQQFPALAIKDNGTPRVYFDNPAGTQVPQRVIDRTVETLRDRNANLGGYFKTTAEAAMLVDEAHQACADFYNAPSAREIIFGQNMTSLTFHMSRCLARDWKAGDEIILSRMDHDANVAPWLLVAEERGMTVRWVDFSPETFEFADDAIDKVLSARTKLLAVGYASNCTGTVNDVKLMARKARAAGALCYVDAVQFAPHCGVDVRDIGCDFLVSSAYKWFGPHQGVLWGREDLLARIFAYKVRPASDELPSRFETGTLSHEGMAGCLGAIEYLESFGEGATRQKRIASSFARMETYERHLTLKLIDGLKTIRGLTIHGVTSANAMHRRVPTVSFTIKGKHPEALAKALAAKNMFAWSGHNYAIEPINRMGLMEGGGVLRAGMAHYNTEAEAEAFVAAVAELAK
jgi:cysteine desulfurase family protein (TIGR01976 family)